MKTNSNFGQLVAPATVDGTPRSAEITYAPAQIVLADRVIPRPTAAVYAEHGYLPINPAPTASAREGYELVRVGWEERDGAIFGVWEERELPPRVRTCTPTALIRVLELVGQWAAVRAALKQQGEVVYETFLASIELKEDAPAFAPFIGWAKQTVGEETYNRLMDAAAQGTEHVNTLTAADFAGGAE